MMLAHAAPEGGFLLASLIIAALPMMLLYKHRARTLRPMHPALVNDPDDDDDDDDDDDSMEEYLLDACIPFLLAVQNIYATEKRRGVRFRGPMEAADVIFARSGSAIGSVWAHVREHDHLFTAEQLRLALQGEFDASPADSVASSWYNYEDDEEGVPADDEEGDLVANDSSGEGSNGDAEHDSDATIPRSIEYLEQLDEGEMSD